MDVGTTNPTSAATGCKLAEVCYFELQPMNVGVATNFLDYIGRKFEA